MLYFDHGVSREEAGEYTCVAKNRHGSKHISSKIDVLCKYSTYIDIKDFLLLSYFEGIKTFVTRLNQNFDGLSNLATPLNDLKH